MVDQPVRKAETPFVDQRHRAEPDHGLGDRADTLAKIRMLAPAALDVGEAEALGEREVGALDDPDGEPGGLQRLEGLVGGVSKTRGVFRRERHDDISRPGPQPGPAPAPNATLEWEIGQCRGGDPRAPMIREGIYPTPLIPAKAGTQVFCV